MATIAEKTLSMTEFKATCLELMDAAAARRIERLHLTKRGKPFVTLEVVETATPAKRPTFDEVFGSMKGTTGLPPGVDIKTLLYSDEDRAAQEARFKEKFAEWL